MSDLERRKAVAEAIRDRIFTGLQPCIRGITNFKIEASHDESSQCADLCICDPGNHRNYVAFQVWYHSTVWMSVNIPNWLLGKIEFPKVKSQKDGGYTDFELTGVKEETIVALLAAVVAEYAK